MVHRAAAAPAEHAAAVRIVDHHHRAEFLGDLNQIRERRNVAIHAEHAVGHDELARIAITLPQLGAQRICIAVGEPADGGTAEPAGVDDAGVVELVAQNHVVAPYQRGHGAQIGGEPRLQDQGRFHTFPLSDLALERFVNLHRPGDGPDRSGSGAKRFHRGLGRRLASRGRWPARDSRSMTCSTGLARRLECADPAGTPARAGPARGPCREGSRALDRQTSVDACSALSIHAAHGP